MAKRKKRPPRELRQILDQPQISIAGEAGYIIKQAEERDTRIVSLGPLVFFSTETGDAWVLDPLDNLALCLARDGERQPFDITETASQFAIDWQANYQIDGEQFVVSDRSGQIRSISGYPVRELKQVIRRAVRRKQR
jgi:hypothetical protein